MIDILVNYCINRVARLKIRLQLWYLSVCSSISKTTKHAAAAHCGSHQQWNEYVSTYFVSISI